MISKFKITDVLTGDITIIGMAVHENLQEILMYLKNNVPTVKIFLDERIFTLDKPSMAYKEMVNTFRAKHSTNIQPT